MPFDFNPIGDLTILPVPEGAFTVVASPLGLFTPKSVPTATIVHRYEYPYVMLEGGGFLILENGDFLEME